MKTPMQNNSTFSETLKSRKTHLTKLLKVIDSTPGKPTAVQTLTTNAIKTEVSLIDHQLKNLS